MQAVVLGHSCLRAQQPPLDAASPPSSSSSSSSASFAFRSSPPLRRPYEDLSFRRRRISRNSSPIRVSPVSRSHVMPLTRGGGSSRGSGTERRSEQGSASQDRGSWKDADAEFVKMLLARGMDVPEDLQRYVPTSTPTPSRSDGHQETPHSEYESMEEDLHPSEEPVRTLTRPRSDQPSCSQPSSSQPSSSRPSSRGDHAVPQVDSVATTPQRCLEFLSDGYTLKDQHNVAKELCRAWKKFQDCEDYRWTYMSPFDQQKILDGVYNVYGIRPGESREMFRIPLSHLATKRISDSIYRARTAAIVKLEGNVDWERAKEHKPSWCTHERWSRYCNKFASEDFVKRSAAGKKNRKKQEVKSTGGSKSFGTVRSELEAALQREPTLREWWEKTHKQGDAWKSDAARAIQERYHDLYGGKHGNVPEDDRPTFDPHIWQEVIDAREVGRNRRQALGGLHPKFASDLPYGTPGTSSSYAPRPSQYTYASDPPREEDERMPAYMTKVVELLHGMNARLTAMERKNQRDKMESSEDDDDSQEDEGDDEDDEEDIPQRRRETITIRERNRGRDGDEGRAAWRREREQRSKKAMEKGKDIARKWRK